MMKMYRMKQWIVWVLIMGISIGTYPIVSIFGATDKRKEPDPKAVVYRVYEAGTTKAISPQKGDVVDIYLTMKDANLKASDFDKIENPMVAKKKTDSFEVTSSANAELSSEIRDYGNDGIVFQIKFSKLEYTGSDDKLIFDFSYQLDGTKKKELIVSVPNCIEYSRSDYTGTTPKIEVNNISFPGTIKAGDTFTLDFHASSNIKDMVFKNVELDYSNVSSGLETTTILDTKKLPNFKAEGPNKTQLILKVKDTLENDFETVTLKYTYSYRQNGEFINDKSNEIKIKIPVVKNKEEEKEDDMKGVPYIVVERYDYGEQVIAGNEVTMKAVLKNASKQYDVQNIAVVFSTSDGLISKEASNKFFINQLKKGGAYEKELTFLVDKDTATGFQTVNFEISYDYKKDKKRETKTTSESMKIAVKAVKKKKKEESETIAKRTPSVMISKYEYGGKVPAGKTFTLDMTLQNTSKELKIENLIMSLEVAEGLSITSSSNTFYFEQLSAGGTATQTVEMQALPNAKSVSTNVTVNFKYEYVDKKERQSITSSEVIAIPIYQPDRMEFMMSELPEFINVGEETNLSIQYVNKGKSSLYNLSAELKGDLTSTEKLQNLGNVDSGNSGSIDFYAVAQQAGTAKGKIVITYEDDNLETKKVVLPYELQAQEMIQDPSLDPSLDPSFDPNMNQEEEAGKLTKPMKIGLAVLGSLLVIVILTVIVVKRKKAKRLKMLEELEEMEDDN